MKTEVEAAIKVLAERAQSKNLLAHEAMQVTQAALNLAHVLATLDNLRK